MRTLCTVAVVLAFGCAETKQACSGSDAKYHNEGLIFHLSKAGVPYKRSQGGGVCVDEKYASQLRAADRELERFYPQIAHKPKDACEERALVEWAEKEKLRFDLRQGYDIRKKPSGNLVLLRAYTKEEMASYREKLDKEAPIGATCN